MELEFLFNSKEMLTWFELTSRHKTSKTVPTEVQWDNSKERCERTHIKKNNPRIKDANIKLIYDKSLGQSWHKTPIQCMKENVPNQYETMTKTFKMAQKHKHSSFSTFPQKIRSLLEIRWISMWSLHKNTVSKVGIHALHAIIILYCVFLYDYCNLKVTPFFKL